MLRYTGSRVVRMLACFENEFSRDKKLKHRQSGTYISDHLKALETFYILYDALAVTLHTNGMSPK